MGTCLVTPDGELGHLIGIAEPSERTTLDAETDANLLSSQARELVKSLPTGGSSASGSVMVSNAVDEVACELVQEPDNFCIQKCTTAFTSLSGPIGEGVGLR